MPPPPIKLIQKEQDRHCDLFPFVSNSDIPADHRKKPSSSRSPLKAIFLALKLENVTGRSVKKHTCKLPHDVSTGSSSDGAWTKWLIKMDFEA